MRFIKRFVPDAVTVLSGPRPPDPLCFPSDHLQILCNSSDTPWVDPGVHFHEASDEAYLVLQGTMTLQIDGELVVVGAGEICFVAAMVPHAVVHVDTPYRGFVIRAPALQDKVYEIGTDAE
ncbi:MAG: cupin domain-containing protein [Thermomicrobiales bacterium]